MIGFRLFEVNTPGNWISEYKHLAFHRKSIYNGKRLKSFGGKPMNMKKMVSCILILCLAVFAFAGCAPATETTATDAAPAGFGAYSGIIMMVLMFALFYLMLIRPENKRKKKAQEMRDSIAVGDKITTIGGIVGKVVHVTGDRITFETGEDRVRMEVTKWAISSNDGRGADKETSDSEETLN